MGRKANEDVKREAEGRGVGGGQRGKGEARKRKQERLADTSGLQRADWIRAVIRKSGIFGV